MGFRAVCALGAALALGGCAWAAAGGGGFGPTTAARTAQRSGRLIVRLRVPKPGRRAHYVAPTTKALTIVTAGPKQSAYTYGVSAGTNPGCSSAAAGTTCTLAIALPPCPSSAACYTASFTTYDAVTGCPQACSIPPGASALSTDQQVTFAIAAGANNTLDLTLDGIAAAVSLTAGAGSALVGTPLGGFTLPKCTIAPQSVTLQAVDADGNTIVGPGSPTLTLRSDDGVHLAARPAGSAAAPNAFTLVPPASLASATIPNAKSVVHLTATATPPTGGGAPTSTAIDVTFDGEICGVFSEFPIPASASVPQGIAGGSDGAVWFAENGLSKIARITTSGVVTNQYPMPTSGAHPLQIVSGPDGALYVTEELKNRIARVTTSGIITETLETTAPNVNWEPWSLVTGSDDALWFTNDNADSIGRLTTGGTLNVYQASTIGDKISIVAGPDGALWFSEAVFAQRIGRMTTDGVLTNQFPVPSSPAYLAVGSDGALWFSESNGKVGRMTTAGTVTGEYSSGITAGASPNVMTGGPDGAVWFTETSAANIGRITTAGGIAEYSVPTISSLAGIGVGPDGAIWFTECSANQIGRLQ